MIHALVLIFYAYLGLGLLFALAFVGVGVTRVDPVARDSGPSFRLLLLPGAILLWPILLRRWLSGSPPPSERTSHREEGDRR